MIPGCQRPLKLSNLSHSEIKLAENSGFKTNIIKTNNFELTSLIKKDFTNFTNLKIKNLVIYIEGDGRSWIKQHLLSKDPTPLTPGRVNLLNKNLIQLPVMPNIGLVIDLTN